MCEINVPQLFTFKFEKFSGIDVAHFFEDGTKLKIHPEIKPPFFT